MNEGQANIASLLAANSAGLKECVPDDAMLEVAKATFTEKGGC